MVELAHLFPNEKDELTKLALNQCARELLLAQSSDWLFMITNGTMVDYAHCRAAETPIERHRLGNKQTSAFGLGLRDSHRQYVIIINHCHKCLL